MILYGQFYILCHLFSLRIFPSDGKRNAPLINCLVNLYLDRKSLVPKHSDDEGLFGRDPIIASISLGETRRFVVEPKVNERPTTSLRTVFPVLLRHDDLLVMKGETQEYWLHSVPPEVNHCKPRINISNSFKESVLTTKMD